MLPAWVALSTYTNTVRRYKTDSCLYSSKVHYGLQDIDLMTKYSGITNEMIANGRPFDEVKADIKQVLETYLVIGHSIKNDLKSLGLEEYLPKCIDIAQHLGGKGRTPIKLRTLAYALTDKRVQEFSVDEKKRLSHSPVTDARICVLLYKRRIRGFVESATDSEDQHSFEFCRQKILKCEEIKRIIEKEERQKKESKERHGTQRRH